MIGGNAAHVLIYSKDKKKILLTQRRDIPMWVMPGGHVEKSETYETAAVREVKEETGLAIKITNLAAKYTNTKISKYVFIGLVTSGNIKTSKETKQVKWFELNDLPMLMTLYERERIQTARFFKGKMIEKELYFDKKRELVFQLKNPLRFFTFLFSSLKKSS